MLEGIAYSQLWKLMSWLPGVLLRRFFSKQRLAQSVRIDVRARNNPVQLFGGESPEATIWLTFQNSGVFAIELDRFTVQLWLGGITVQFFNLDRVTIPAGSQVEAYVRGAITASHLRHYVINAKNNDGEVAVDVRAEFNSKVHNFSVNTGNLSGIKPRTANLPKVEHP